MRDLSKRDWLLILLAYRGAPEALDPVRTQLAMFLFAEPAACRSAPATSSSPGPTAR